MKWLLEINVFECTDEPTGPCHKGTKGTKNPRRNSPEIFVAFYVPGAFVAF
jgi:hypothetical protein